jgi:hypothetical protein
LDVAVALALLWGFHGLIEFCWKEMDENERNDGRRRRSGGIVYK